MASSPTAHRLVPIKELNRLPREQLVPALRPLFEAAPTLADALFAERPYESYAQLLDRAAGLIDPMSAEDKVAVINAHPRIGESPDVVRQTSALSYREQGYEREADLERDEVERVYRELAELNATYEARFGFRFVVFVNRRPKSAIVEVIRGRLGRSRAEEMAAALGEMLAIARDRLSYLRAR